MRRARRAVAQVKIALDQLKLAELNLEDSYGEQSEIVGECVSKLKEVYGVIRLEEVSKS